MKTFLSFIIVLLLWFNAAAQSGQTIKFAKGATSVVVTGEIERGEVAYIIFARSGQIIEARAEAERPDIYVTIRRLDADADKLGNGKQDSYTVLKTGKYAILLQVAVRIGALDEQEAARRARLGNRYELEISLKKADAPALAKAREEARKPKPPDEAFPPFEPEKPKR